MAHDLRAPLHSLQSFAQILLEDYSDHLDVEGRGYAQRIVTAARRLDALMHDLLTYSHLGRAAMMLEPVNLEEVVEQVLTELKAEIRTKAAHVTVDRPLPQVFGHSTTLVQVVSHLLMNGLKFVAPGIRPHVQIWTTERDEWVRLWIRDNGIGIAAVGHERIFAVFERLHGVDVYLWVLASGSRLCAKAWNACEGMSVLNQLSNRAVAFGLSCQSTRRADHEPVVNSFPCLNG